MIEIKDLLLNFDHLLVGEEEKLKSVIEAIKEAAGVDIKKEEIRLKNGTIFLNTKPIYKNQIFMKREEIFSKLKVILGKKAPENFR